MKKYILLLLLSASVLIVNAQTTPDSVTILLHKFEQHIGKEIYRVSKTANMITYTINFKFVDRGSPVPLKAEMAVTPTFEPLHLFIKGSVARSASINDTIYVKAADGKSVSKVDDSTYTKKLQPNTFTIASYAPGTVQQALIQYWKRIV